MVQGRFISLTALFCACAAVAGEPSVKSALPDSDIPIPQSRPDDTPAAAPIPLDKPSSADDGKRDATRPSDAATGKQDAPAPPWPNSAPSSDGKPSLPANEPPSKQKGEAAPEDKGAPAPTQTEAEPPEKENPEAYAACLSNLKEAGVEFSEEPSIDDGKGCGMDKPLKVRTVLPGIKLEPEATMRCQTAFALSRWAKTSVLPAAEIAYGPNAPRITAVNQATSYACRNRNHADSGKISEHAHGNAIDIAGFTFSDGKTFVIEPREKDSTLTGAFERAITASACLFFTTVLGPGSDAAHETHLHLDVMKRKGDYRYCW